MRCDACRLWETNDTTDKKVSGVCRRYPPVILYNDQHVTHGDVSPIFTGSPATAASNWCGDFQAMSAAAVCVTDNDRKAAYHAATRVWLRKHRFYASKTLCQVIRMAQGGISADIIHKVCGDGHRPLRMRIEAVLLTLATDPISY